ncbi:MAG: Spy/CpxP family protein refolding chaperone [Hyphomicrobiales bacterium]|nr:Spy/CpxP family protein refolding chaperone [Hyphomicrobiales bacterium]
MKSTLKTLAIALAMTAPFAPPMIAPAVAQSAADHDAHHPQLSAVPAPAPVAPPAAQSGPAGVGGIPMMNMMGEGGGMDMPGMMRMMSMMDGGMAGSGMSALGALDHIEGRLAYLRAELRITDAQTAAWNAFADALRAQAQKLGQLRGPMMMQGAAQQAPTLVDRFDQQERWLTARLDGVRAIKAVFAPLFATLSDDQKKTADELLGPHFGAPMMGFAGMMGGGMMQPGQAKPGAAMPMPGMGR